MAMLSIYITSLTATYVHPQYNGNTLLHFHDNDGYATHHNVMLHRHCLSCSLCVSLQPYTKN